MEHIKPTNDLAVKKVFASEENKDILQGLIFDFFGIQATNIVIENPYSIEAYQAIIKGMDVRACLVNPFTRSFAQFSILPCQRETPIPQRVCTFRASLHNEKFVQNPA